MISVAPDPGALWTLMKEFLDKCTVIWAKAVSEGSHGPWWIEPIITGASIVVGAAMIMWQQRASNRSNLKLKLFDELREALQTAGEEVTRAGMYAFGAPTHIKIYHDMMARGYRAAIPQDRIPKFNEQHFAAVTQITRLISILESYDIISEHFELFRRALGCAQWDISRAFTALTPTLYKAFPIDVPGKPEPIVPPAGQAEIEELSDLCNRYWKTMSTVSCYIHDMKIEAQNVLLRKIFHRRVPSRKPPDKSLWVLRTDDRKYLRRVRKFFLEEHPAAVLNRKYEAEAAERPANTVEAK